ncbi:hypothetical protein [Neobacillus niacini]|uniref:hypothetical protein n=1 Tax=Neobacillus niacini TaxID=86668 RepID=UPI0021CB3FEF|nr:hypothetical protein [Neobacillus niacini]MCM3764479.1 hypothetical protein [Neobacillus niacini]
MLKTILRSPIFPIILLIFIIASLVLQLNTQPLLGRICSWTAFIFALIWTILIKRQNNKDPKGSIKLSGFIPYEFREMDEGQQWVTFKACRNVYIYYSLAIPIAAFICFIFSKYIFVPLLSIGALGVGQYIVYWMTTSRLLKRT